MAQSYTGPIFGGQPDWARVPVARLESFHWEGGISLPPRLVCAALRCAGGGDLCAYVVV